MNYSQIETTEVKSPNENRIFNEKVISDYGLETSIAIRHNIDLDTHRIGQIEFFSEENSKNLGNRGFSKPQRLSIYSPAISLKENTDKSIDIIIEPSYPVLMSKVIFKNNGGDIIEGEVIGFYAKPLDHNKVFYEIKTNKLEYIKISVNECFLNSNYKFLYFYEMSDQQKPNVICAFRYKEDLNIDIENTAKEQFLKVYKDYNSEVSEKDKKFLISSTLPREHKILKTDSYVRVSKWRDLILNLNNQKKPKP